MFFLGACGRIATAMVLLLWQSHYFHFIIFFIMSCF